MIDEIKKRNEYSSASRRAEWRPFIVAVVMLALAIAAPIVAGVVTAIIGG